MLKFAVLDSNNIVENIIVAESKETAESILQRQCILIDSTTVVQIGMIWDGTEFNNPE
jgi:hypothetical protein